LVLLHNPKKKVHSTSFQELIVIRNKDSVQKAKVEDLENLVKKLEFEKSTLEEMCTLKDEEALISQVKSDERLANLHNLLMNFLKKMRIFRW
jgi:predicted nuclease with TOPRIM domain